MIYIFIAVLIWSSSFVVGKYTYAMFDPAMAIQLRLIIASLIVLPFFIKTYPTIDKTLKNKLWGISFLMFPISIFMQFMGLFYTSASSAIVIVGTEPILILLVGFLLFKQKVNFYHWLLSLLVFFGICLLVFGSKNDNTINLFGIFLVFVAGVGFAISVHLSKNIMNQIDNKIYTAVVLTQGMILSLPISLLSIKTWNIHFNWIGLFSIFYLGIGCSWLAYKLWNIGLNKTPAHICGMMIGLEPIFGLLLAFIFLGERMTLLTIIGSILVIGSVMILTFAPILKEKWQHQF